MGLNYEITPYLSDEKTRLAPPELFAIHPLGKSPVIIDCATVVHESGAIVDYLVGLSGGKLSPAPASADYDRYMQWLHYAEGSAMLPLMLKMYTGRLGDAAAPLQPRIDSEIANHLGYVEQALDGVNYLVGDNFSAADVQRSFVGEVAGAFGLRSGYTRQPTLRRLIKIYAPTTLNPLMPRSAATPLGDPITSVEKTSLASHRLVHQGQAELGWGSQVVRGTTSGEVVLGFRAKHFGAQHAGLEPQADLGVGGEVGCGRDCNQRDQTPRKMTQSV